jgi:hypothetical protein
MGAYKDVGRLIAVLFTAGREGGVGVFLLAGIFAWSGTAKLRHPLLTSLAMVDFGVLREPRIGPGRAVAYGELALAAALLVSGASASVTALTMTLAGAAGLLWVFAFLIARSLIARRAFPCHCFGYESSKISAWTLSRTILLASLASGLAASVQHEPSISGTSPKVLVLQSVIAGAILGTVALLGQIGRLTRSAATIRTGTPHDHP